MIKPASLRAALEKAIPYIKRNPEKLHAYVEAGNVLATAAASNSFEYDFTLVMLLEAYSGNGDMIFLTIVRWLREHQIETLLNPEKMADALSFDVDIINDKTVDILIKLQLTERVIVDETGKMDHPPEPVFADRHPGPNGAGWLADRTELDHPA